MLSNVIESYANAFINLGQDLSKLEGFLEDAARLRKILDENPKFLELLKSYNVTDENKHTIVQNVFAKNFLSYTKNFVHVTIDRKAIFYIEEIIIQIIKSADEILNIKDVYIYSTTELTKGQMNKIKVFVEKKYMLKAYVHNRIDKNLIGGVKIVIADVVIDDSISHKLKDICNQLIEVRK